MAGMGHEHALLSTEASARCRFSQPTFAGTRGNGRTTRDEIGQLSAAFNRMIEQLRHKEKIRETFGRYLDPKIVEDLIDRPTLAATEGQRQIMTVMFCDVVE
jgi:HAMP domain